MPFIHHTPVVSDYQVWMLNWNDDNYIYFPTHVPTKTCLVIDPGENSQVMDFLIARQLRPLAVLCTHHHYDHIDGAAGLSRSFNIPLVCSAYDRARIAGSTESFPTNGLWEKGHFSFAVRDIPGHTLGHVALHEEKRHWLFTGDTLFLYGCGRLFEGTPAQMQASLKSLSALPPETQIFCGHEYTMANLAFARHLDPNDQALVAEQRKVRELLAASHSTMPGLMSEQVARNPFMRSEDPVFRATAGHSKMDALGFFTEMRERKNTFVPPAS